MCRAAGFGREDEWGSGYACILFGREDESKVAALASAEVALDGHCVFRQELMGILGGDIVQLAGVLGGLRGREPHHCDNNRCGGRHGFNAEF